MPCNDHVRHLDIDFDFKRMSEALRVPFNKKKSSFADVHASFMLVMGNGLM